MLLTGSRGSDICARSAWRLDNLSKSRGCTTSLISEKVYAPTPWPASVLRSVGGTTGSLLFSSTSQQIIPPEVDLPGDILMCKPAQLRSYGHSKTAWPMPRRTARNIKRDIAPTNRVNTSFTPVRTEADLRSRPYTNTSYRCLESPPKTGSFGWGSRAIKNPRFRCIRPPPAKIPPLWDSAM
jgi:hypothetical protein